MLCIKNTKCCVKIDGKVTELFASLFGLRQGCLLSPTLFIIFLEYVMKKLKAYLMNFYWQMKTCHCILRMLMAISCSNIPDI